MTSLNETVAQSHCQAAFATSLVYSSLNMPGEYAKQSLLPFPKILLALHLGLVNAVCSRHYKSTKTITRSSQNSESIHHI